MKFVAKPLLPTENVARLFSFEKKWRPGAPIQIHSHSLLTKELIIEYRKTILQRLYVAFISWPTATCNIFSLQQCHFLTFWKIIFASNRNMRQTANFSEAERKQHDRTSQQEPGGRRTKHSNRWYLFIF